jgi:hypothetical protein
MMRWVWRAWATPWIWPTSHSAMSMPADTPAEVTISPASA